MMKLAIALTALLGASLASAQSATSPSTEPPPTRVGKPARADAPVHPVRSVEGSGPGLHQPDTDLIDVPTAGILDYQGYSSRTRFFSNGGVMQWLSFGVFQRLNIGTSMNVDRLLGTSSPVQVTRPDLQVKIRAYDGDRSIPAVSVGFDGQGYLYNRKELRYNQRQRGLYLVGSQELFVPGFELHGGMNISDFNSNAIFGSVAASYNIEDRVLLMGEWDNISNYIDSRASAGARVYITDAFHIDFAVRGIGQTGEYSNGVSRGPERVVQLKYTSSF